MKLAPCPKCGSSDVYIDSNRHVPASWIECDDCDNRMQEAVDEDALTERWNALDRSAMPSFDDSD